MINSRVLKEEVREGLSRLSFRTPVPVLSERAASQEMRSAFVDVGGFIVRCSSEESSKYALRQVDRLFPARIPNRFGQNEEVLQYIPGATEFAYRQGINYLHTDNAYAPISPDVLSIQCLRPADIGGESFLVEVHRLKQALEAIDPAFVCALSQQEAVTYYRLFDQVGYRGIPAPVFFSEGGVQKIRFTTLADVIAGKSELEDRAFKVLFRLAHSPEVLDAFQLRQWDLLVFDNHRFLHGRNAFSGERRVKRVCYRG